MFNHQFKRSHFLIISLCLFCLLGMMFPLSSLAEQAIPVQRRPAMVQDKVPAGSAFDRFRQDLLKAVRDRNAPFIRSIASPKISLSLGRERITLDDLKFENPKSEAWFNLEQAISFGCTSSRSPSGKESWGGPPFPNDVPSQSIGTNDIYVAKNVSVRSQPQADASVIGTLSNELVKLSSAQKVPGWIAIQMPEGKIGYVLTTQGFQALGGYHATFERNDDRWIMTIFAAGE